MNNLMNRTNNLVAFTMTTLSVLTFLCFASTFLTNYSEPVDYNVKVSKLKLRNLPDYQNSQESFDLGTMRFDLKADFAPVFNWNVKQLFIYLLVEYKTQKNVKNQIVLWDWIMKREDRQLLNLRSEGLKYYFKDDGHGLIGNDNVTLTLHWNVVPNAGQLSLWPGKGSYKVPFPMAYTATA